jgi:hypothetical protein
MLHFPIDPTPWDPDSLAKMGLGPNRRTFSHIPTGLYVAGFLANAGLLSVDVEVARRLRERAIAHLRFVDDHIILAYSMDDLTGWVHEYNELLSKFRTGARINHEKVEPKDLARLIFGGKGERAENKLQTLREHAAT